MVPVVDGPGATGEPVEAGGEFPGGLGITGSLVHTVFSYLPDVSLIVHDRRGSNGKQRGQLISLRLH